MRSASFRTICGALLALLLSVRLLSPAGFMPAFEHGSVTIVPCPDQNPAPAPMVHHHHGPKQLHQPCPYAAGNAPAALPEIAYLAALLLVGGVLLPAATFRDAALHRIRQRPPSRGPPLTA
jgi:hypothetical protein